jgi:hypothetical protein
MTDFLPSHGAAIPHESLTAEDPQQQQAGLMLLAKLELSLSRGQKALLARDADELEKATGEQIRLCQALEVLLFPAKEKCRASTELYAAVCRVLQLARVQDALLRRSQGFLLALGNLANGPEATYEALLSTRALRPAARRR